MVAQHVGHERAAGAGAQNYNVFHRFSLLGQQWWDGIPAEAGAKRERRIARAEMSRRKTGWLDEQERRGDSRMPLLMMFSVRRYVLGAADWIDFSY
jgi:hypothetical protein